MEQTVIKKIIRINVGGTSYKCFAKTLTAFSESKLANLDKEVDSFDFEQNEFFFDRNPILFAFILDSFRKGAVHLPKDLCGTTFRQELEFWEISPRYVAPCCWEALYGSEDDIATVNSLVQSFKENSNSEIMTQENADFKTKLWLFLEEPKSSRYALIWSIFISCVIISATMTDCLATTKRFQENFTESEMKLWSQLGDHFGYADDTLAKLSTVKPKSSIMYITAGFHAILTLELVSSFLVCPDKKKFVCCFSRLLAGFGYLSCWIALALFFNMSSLRSIHALNAQFIFTYLTIFKIARLLYLTKSIPAFRLICLSFASSKQEFKILIFLLVLFVLVFGYILYAAEFLHNSNITNLFTAIYWAVITMTTVGYGNYVPVTPVGHVVAGACAVCSVLVLALPVGIIVSKFYKYYDFYSYTKVQHTHYNTAAFQSKSEGKTLLLSSY